MMPTCMNKKLNTCQIPSSEIRRMFDRFWHMMYAIHHTLGIELHDMWSCDLCKSWGEERESWWYTDSMIWSCSLVSFFSAGLIQLISVLRSPHSPVLSRMVRVSLSLFWFTFCSRVLNNCSLFSTLDTTEDSTSANFNSKWHHALASPRAKYLSATITH